VVLSPNFLGIQRLYQLLKPGLSSLGFAMLDARCKKNYKLSCGCESESYIAGAMTP
jgi:hypothetical protein